MNNGFGPQCANEVAQHNCECCWYPNCICGPPGWLYIGIAVCAPLCPIQYGRPAIVSNMRPNTTQVAQNQKQTRSDLICILGVERLCDNAGQRIGRRKAQRRVGWILAWGSKYEA